MSPNLDTLILLTISRTAEGLVNLGSLAGAYTYTGSASITISVTAGDDGSFTR
jgi:hypothetical protein